MHPYIVVVTQLHFFSLRINYRTYRKELTSTAELNLAASFLDHDWPVQLNRHKQNVCRVGHLMSQHFHCEGLNKILNEYCMYINVWGMYICIPVYVNIYKYIYICIYIYIFIHVYNIQCIYIYMHVIKMLIKITLSYRMAVDLWQDFGCLQDKAAIIAPTFLQ